MKNKSPIPWEPEQLNRILYFAPHPDDESLAGGCLLQRAAACGAEVRVIFATNGESNPWPQRAFEKRWFLDHEVRSRWSLRRQREATSALQVLGLPEACAAFLGLPDQGLTRLFQKDPHLLATLLRQQIEDFQPDIIFQPSQKDRHPDHRALSRAIILGAGQMEMGSPQIFEYWVHGSTDVTPTLTFALTSEEMEMKRRAILCHETQMLLSRRRFLSYVKDAEHFWAVTPLVNVSSLQLEEKALESLIIEEKMHLSVSSASKSPEHT